MPSLRLSHRLALPGIAMLAAAVLVSGCAKPRQDTFQGYVEGEFVYIASSQPGRLDQLSVHRGQTVGARAPLFALESGNEIAAEREAREQWQATQAQLQDLKTGKRPPEVDVTRAQLAQALADDAKAAAQWTRDQAQYAAGGISRAQMEDSRALARSSAARVRELKSQLAVARLPGREAQIAAQTAQAAAAQAALAQAVWKLDQKTVKATRAGKVFDTMYREGEWVPAGSPVVRLLPPENIKVRFFVPEPVLGKLSTGQAVSLHCDGCGAEVPAHITYIATESEYTPPVIYSNETRAKLVYMIEARPAPQDAARLHPGQPLEVTLR